jgi:hypothetical protein
MSPGRFLTGLAATLGTPILCLAALIGVAAFNNSRPQTGSVTCGVSQLWVLPGGTVTLNVARTPILRAGTVPPPPLDVVIVVDQSGSMTRFAPYLPDAVYNATDVLNRPDLANRFALVYFSDAANAAGGNKDNIVSHWTHDVEEITKAAERELAGGQTDSEQLIGALRTVLPDSSLGLQRIPVVILLTDTEIEPPGRVTAEAERLRSRGVRIYVLLPDDAIDRRTAEDISGSADNVASMANEASFNGLLTRTAADLLTNALSGTKAEAWIHPSTFAVDGEHAVGRSWSREGQAKLTSRTKYMSDAGVLYQLPLVPQKLGLWLIGERDAEIAAIDEVGRASVEACSRSPMVLVTPPWLLLVALLPALLWLAHAIQYWLRKPSAYLAPSLAPAMIERVVRTLPLPTAVERNKEMLVPTLVVGVGERGSRAIETLQGDLQESGCRGAAKLAAVLSRPTSTSASGVSKFVMPPEFAATSTYVPAPGDPLAPELRWFDPHAHRDLSRDQLDASAGGATSRTVNRFALLHWLQAGLRMELERCGNEFASSVATAGQVMIVGDVEEAFVSASLIDITTILRSATAQRAIDVSFVLLSEWSSTDDLNRNSFLQELESCACMDLRRSVASGGGDGRAPFDHLFVIEGAPGSSEQMASDAVVMLTRRNVAQLVYSDSRSVRRALSSGTRKEMLATMRIVAAKVGFRSHSLADVVALELVQRWLASSVLGGAEASSHGGYRLCPARGTGATLIAELLTGKYGRLTDGARLLLIACEDNGDATELLSTLHRAGSLRDDVLRRMTTQLLNELITRIGRHNFRMSDALAVMRTVTEAIDGAKFERRITGAGELATYLESIRGTVLPAMEKFRAVLEKEWVSGAIDHAFRAREAQDHLLRQDLKFLERGLRRDVDRTLIDQLAHEFNAQLTRGIGGADSADWITLHARIDSGEPVVEARISIGQPFATYSPSEFFEAVEKRARMAVSALQPYTLAWLLQRRPESVVELAPQLKLDPGFGGHAIVLKPEADESSSARMVERLIAHIPPLSGTTHTEDAFTCSDARWVRRLACAESPTWKHQDARPGKFVTMHEQAAERARERLQSEYDVKVAVFPAALRAAFVDTDAICRFARLHAAGKVVRRLDDVGRLQWCLGLMTLTHGADPTLAEALACYVLSGTVEDVNASKSQDSAHLHVDREALSDRHNVDALTKAVLAAALRGLL